MANTTTDPLVTKLEAARDAYYGPGKPIMSDAEYDALEARLRKRDPQHPFLAGVGAATTSGWPKVRHDIPMGSLGKSQNEADMRSWDPGGLLSITEKLDGISICLVYRNGKFAQGITRGDGVVGDDITRNVKLMRGCVKQLPAKLPDGSATPDVLYVRGEVICKKSDFAAHFKGESNPRNTASGTAKRQSDPGKCRHLTILAYQLLPDGQPLDSKKGEIKALADLGFQVPNALLAKGGDDVMEVYQRYVDTDRDALDYEIDGLVVEVNARDEREALGMKNHRPAGATAFKFPHEEMPTILRNIRWQVGNSGRITPVAEWDTVVLAGANVSQASLHNISTIARLAGDAGQEHLAAGDKILVARRNDVIPYFEAVLEPNENATDDDVFHTPTECPSCKSTLLRDGEYLVCRNEDCEAQAVGAIKRWVKKLGVLHVGESLIEAWVEAGLIEDAADLYTLDPKEAAAVDVSGRKAGGSASKAQRNLNAKMTLPLHVFVGSLGIPLIGRSMAKTIVDGGFDSLSKMLTAKVSQVAAIPGVGQSKATSFVLTFHKKTWLISKLLSNGIQIQQVADGPLKGKAVCLTGFRDAELVDAIELMGGTVKSSVSKVLDYLILQDPTSTSGKAKKAHDYNATGVANIKLIGVDEAWKLAGGRPAA